MPVKLWLERLQLKRGKRCATLTQSSLDDIHAVARGWLDLEAKRNQRPGLAAVGRLLA